MTVSKSQKQWLQQVRIWQYLLVSSYTHIGWLSWYGATAAAVCVWSCHPPGTLPCIQYTRRHGSLLMVHAMLTLALKLYPCISWPESFSIKIQPKIFHLYTSVCSMQTSSHTCERRLCTGNATTLSESKNYTNYTTTTNCDSLHNRSLVEESDSVVNWSFLVGRLQHSVYRENKTLCSIWTNAHTHTSWYNQQQSWSHVICNIGNCASPEYSVFGCLDQLQQNIFFDWLSKIFILFRPRALFYSNLQ